MTRITKLAMLAVLCLATAASAQQMCPCVPITHLWIVKECQTWNCAASALVMANGDKYTMTMPTGSDDFQWVVVQRIAAGTATTPPDSPFVIETFDTMNDASARFASVTSDFHPMMMTVPDGKVVVVSRRTSDAHRHAAGH